MRFVLNLQRFVLLLTFCFTFSLCLAQKRYHGDGIDDVLRFVPWASVVGLKIVGVSSKNDWKHFGTNAALSASLTVGTTFILKKSIRAARPDGTDYSAFPSGHTSFAFAGAHVLHKEFGSVSPWISVSGYLLAVATAADRVRRNRHEWDDVVAGAAIGLASTELGYWLSRKILPENVDVSVSPNVVSCVFYIK